MISQYEKPERRWIVSCDNDDMNITFLCSCQLFESDGIPCCHIFSVLKHQMRTRLPDSLVKKRWTKEASVMRTLLSSGLANDNAVQLARYGDLMSACAKFCHFASFSDEGYEEAKEVLSQLTICAQKYRVPNQNAYKFDSSEGLHPNVIKDPNVCYVADDKGTAESSDKDGCIKSKHMILFNYNLDPKISTFKVEIEYLETIRLGIGAGTWNPILEESMAKEDDCTVTASCLYSLIVTFTNQMAVINKMNPSIGCKFPNT
ncbi:hypothetical protein ACLB2K_070834 [Fragaria x ananassa]